jgi:hypothetical protein
VKVDFLKIFSSFQNWLFQAAIGDSHVCVLGDEVDGDGSIVSVVNVVHGILVVNQVTNSTIVDTLILAII